jgi:hypothetical protein
MKITFDEAQQALGKLRKKRLPNGQQQVPAIMKVKGKAGIKVYQLKCDLENAFEAEIERFRDLSQEAQQADEERMKEINEQVDELFKEEKEVELSRGKLDENEIENVLDADLLTDLRFAINLNGEQVKNESK